MKEKHEVKPRTSLYRGAHRIQGTWGCCLLMASVFFAVGWPPSGSLGVEIEKTGEGLEAPVKWTGKRAIHKYTEEPQSSSRSPYEVRNHAPTTKLDKMVTSSKNRVGKNPGDRNTKDKSQRAEAR